MEKKQYIFGTAKANKEGLITVVASDESKDRHGEVVKVDGWDLKNFLKNPTMLVGHDYSGTPVGKWNSPRVEKGKLLMDAEFAKTDKGREVETLANDKIFQAVSVGFIVKSRDEEDESIITEAELLEVSWVSVPANPNALQRAIEKGYTFSMGKSEEAKKDEELLKHYREIIKEYRKGFKELTKEFGIELETEGKKIEEAVQVKAVIEQATVSYKDLISKAKAVTQLDPQSTKETLEVTAKGLLNALTPLIAKQVKKDLGKYL